MSDTITERDLLEAVHGAVMEMLHYIDSDNADDYDDALTEYADGLINPYYYQAIEEWTVAGFPDIEELGGIAPIHDKDDTTLQRIAREASHAMFYWYHAELVRELDEQLNARKAGN